MIVLAKFARKGTTKEKQAFNRFFDSLHYQNGSMLKALKREIQKVNKEAENDITNLGDIVREWVNKYEILETEREPTF